MKKKNKTLIISHRGVSEILPENTLLAFDQAHKEKADGIELDVLQSLDRKIIVHHDPFLNKKNKLTHKINYLYYDQIQQISKTPICTLNEVFYQFKNSFKVINVEIKSTDIFSDGIETNVVKLIQKYQMEDKVRISSFNPLSLIRIKKMNPEINLGYLISPDNWYTKSAWALNQLPTKTTIHLDQKFLANNYQQKIKNWKTPLWIWTVNDETNLKSCINHPSISGIITDNPKLALKIRDNI